MLEMLLAGRSKALPRFDYTGPGPQQPIAGTMNEGFFGEVTTEELFNDFEFFDGVNYYPTAIALRGWLKFYIDGKILFVSKYPVASAVTYTALYAAGLVYGDDTIGEAPLTPTRLQDAKLFKNEHRFSVRLFSGAPSNPFNENHGSSNDITAVYGTEWNRLMHAIKANRSSDTPTETWASYENAEIGSTTNNATSWEWVKELSSVANSSVVRRFFSSQYSTTLRSNTRFWRPVLELLPRDVLIGPVILSAKSSDSAAEFDYFDLMREPTLIQQAFIPNESDNAFSITQLAKPLTIEVSQIHDVVSALDNLMGS